MNEINRKPNTTLFEHTNPNFTRIKVLSEDVKYSDSSYIPKEYRGIIDTTKFCDHRRYLKLKGRIIGFMVSPHNLNIHRHKALELPNHTVIEVRQYYAVSCETIAVIKNEFVKYAILWKLYELKEPKQKLINEIEKCSIQ